MFTNKDLRNLIVPLIIEQVLAVTIGIADTVMVSSCGEAAVSGISLVDSINMLLITVFTALATGGSVIAAQYIGRGDKKNARLAAKQLFYVVTALSALLALLAIVLRDPALRWIFGAIDADVMANARVYFFLSALSYPALGIYNGGAALFRAMGDSRTSMLTSVLMNLMNVGGNALLIYVFQMGVAGAALASLVSRVVGAVLITVLLFNKKRAIYYEALHRMEFQPGLIKSILHIGVPNGLENSVFQIGKILVASIVSGFGTVAISANAVANNLASLQIIPGMAIGTAMITVVGQCVGAQDYDAVRRYVRKLMLLAYAVVWGMTAVMLLLNGTILSFYALSEESRALAGELFLVHSICCVVLWPAAFALPNALRAANDVRYTMLVSLFSMWIFRIGCSYLLAQYFGLGVLGTWIAMCIDWLFRAILFVVRFLGGKWKNISYI